MGTLLAQKIRLILARNDFPLFALATADDDLQQNIPFTTEMPEYLIRQKELGEGQQGAVFKARSRRSNVPVAIKFELSQPRLDHSKFIKEARLAFRASAHANVVGIHSFGQWTSGDDEMLYIIFEFMDGGHLRCLAKTGSFSEEPNATKATLDARLSTIGECVSGLNFMHEKGLVHRDIKPENLLLGPDGIVRVADFGLARDVDGSQSASRTPVSAPGTPGYQAPELIMGSYDRDDPNAAKAIDIFAMGITAYEILCNKKPFMWSTTETGQDAWEQEVRTGNIQFHGDGSRISKRLRDTIAAMLQHNPSKRPKIDDVLDVVGAEVHQASLHVSTEFDQIRKAIINKVQAICSTFADSRLPIVPQIDDEDKHWYMTILVRPVERLGIDRPNKGGDGREPMGEVLYPIYLPHYEGTRLKHWCDWLQDTNQPFTPLDIGGCCSGLVIDYYDDDKRSYWESQNWIKNEYVRFFTTDGVLRYLSLRKIRIARGLTGTPPEHAHLITTRYLTDHERNGARGLGFYMSNLEEEHHEMSDHVQTAIVVPIYAPGALHKKTGDDIVGVVNLEWVHPLNETRIKQIGAQVSKWVNKEHRFPISPLIAELVEIVTNWRARAAEEPLVPSQDTISTQQSLAHG